HCNCSLLNTKIRLLGDVDPKTGQRKRAFLDTPDLTLYAAFGEIQKRYQYPHKIVTATGKNSKERVLKAIELLNGSVSLAASVQSTDPEVLKIVKRDNISLDNIVSEVHATSVLGGNYSEIILGLPGDSLQKHVKSMLDMIDCGIKNLRVGQLMILNDTPMASPAYQQKYGLQTRYRFLTKGFIKLPLAGGEQILIEEEKISVGTSDMSFADYLRARVAGLLVNIFYNDRFIPDNLVFFKQQNFSLSGYMAALIDVPRSPAIEGVLAQFVAHLQTELFESREQMQEFLTRKDTFKRLLSGEIGINLTSFYTQACRKNRQDLLAMESSVMSKLATAHVADYLTVQCPLKI
ncbi:MAG: cobalamin B12-binding protein, partial [Magnetococcales bacterium]|nr:cobalamin B12-binding protein [Magnetococcales bacterium]